MSACGSVRSTPTPSATSSARSRSPKVPVDVVQKVLGHASLQTTTIYVQAEKQRVVEEVAAYYMRLGNR